MKKLIILFFTLGSLTSAAASVVLTCPAPNQLKKDPATQVWYVGSNLKNADFKSYDLSFAKNIVSFVGAQWQGQNVGTVNCVYEPGDKYTFSIILAFGHLVREPIQGAWGPNQGGYRNCTATVGKPLTLADCSFVPMMKDSQTDMYQQLEEMKGSQ